jgi:hypothetical protein
MGVLPLMALASRVIGAGFAREAVFARLLDRLI